MATPTAIIPMPSPAIIPWPHPLHALIVPVISFRLSGGELFDYVVQKEFLPELEAKHYLKQILSGLQHMHSKGIVHLDLKVPTVW